MDYPRIVLRNIQTGKVFDNEKSLEEQGIKSGMRLEVLWKKDI